MAVCWEWGQGFQHVRCSRVHISFPWRFLQMSHCSVNWLLMPVFVGRPVFLPVPPIPSSPAEPSVCLNSLPVYHHSPFLPLFGSNPPWILILLKAPCCVWGNKQGVRGPVLHSYASGPARQMIKWEEGKGQGYSPSKEEVILEANGVSGGGNRDRINLEGKTATVGMCIFVQNTAKICYYFILFYIFIFRRGPELTEWPKLY